MNKKQTDDAIDIKIDYLKSDIEDVKRDIEFIKQNFVTRKEFDEKFQSLYDQFILVRNGFFGMIGLIVTAVLGAAMNLIIRKP